MLYIIVLAKMRVILDTNIIRQDMLLRSPRVDLLLDFLSKTRGRLKIPDIVYQEIRALYVREIKRHHSQLEKSRRKLQDLIIDHDISHVELDMDAQADRYVQHLRNRLNLCDSDIVPYKNDYLPDVVRRATNRLHPFTEERKEFRDVLLWLTILDICASQKEDTVVLISNNTKDFADKEGKKLHPALAKEALDKGFDIRYYQSLDNFLEAHATKFEYVTPEWILEHIDTSALQQQVESQLRHRGESLFQSYLERHENDEFNDPSLICVLSFELSSFYCLEMSDESIRIQATFESECEIEYGSYREEEEEYEDFDYAFDPLECDWDFTYVTKTRVILVGDTRCAYPWIESQVDIKVKDKEVEAIDVIEWYLQ